MKRVLSIIFLFIFFISCNNDEVDKPQINKPSFINSVDISRYPEISNSNPIFYDLDGNEKDFLNILKENGINTIRLRLWVNPTTIHSGFNEVKEFSETLKSKGFKIWLTLHYSDTWADPANQTKPLQWESLTFNELKTTVYNYTQNIVNTIKPDYIQIGNEINSGFLHPQGHIINNLEQFLELMTTAINSVRESNNSTKIILHFAGLENSDWFFNKVKDLDYDIIGLSYYPIWHGKSLDNLKTTMDFLSETHQKEILIAETAYPFTLQWNDWTNNIVGLDEQLILPDFPATNEGQRKFIKNIKEITKQVDKGIGFCYWGAELIAWKGNESQNASPWENQALFNFENHALPVFKEFISD